MLWTLTFTPPKYIQLFDRDLRFSLKLYYCFPWIFFFLTFQILFFFSSPSEEYAQQLKEKAGWSMQTVSSVRAAGREEGQQESCDWARGSCPQLACVAITVEMKAQQVSKEFSHGSCWIYKLGPQYNLISWNVKWLKLAACFIGVGFVFWFFFKWTHCTSISCIKKKSYQCLMIA